MEGQVVGDEPEVRLQFGIFENVPPLAAVRPGGVLQEQADLPFAGGLEVDAMGDAINGEMGVAAHGGVETQFVVRCRRVGRRRRRSGVFRIAVSRFAHDFDETADRRVVGAVVADVADDLETVVDARRLEVLVERTRAGLQQRVPIGFWRADREIRRHPARPPFDGCDCAVLNAHLPSAGADAEAHRGVPEAGVQAELGVAVRARLHGWPIDDGCPLAQVSIRDGGGKSGALLQASRTAHRRSIAGVAASRTATVV